MSFKKVSTALFIALIVALLYFLTILFMGTALDILMIVALLFVAIWSYRVDRSKVDHYILWTILCTAAYYILASILSYLLIRYIPLIIIYVVTIFILLWWQKKYIEMKTNPSVSVMRVLFYLDGRISRSDFWLKGMLPMIALNIFGISLFYIHVLEVHAVLFSIMLIFPAVAIYSKRLHDRDMSAWYILIVLIPVFGPIWLFLETWFLKGTVGDNRFGADPLKNDLTST